MPPMKHLLFFLLTSTSIFAQNIRSISFAELDKRIASEKETLVVNFWATWCKPCVAELPAFERLEREYKEKNVKVLLVNLDFNSKIESLVIPFVKRKSLQSEVIHVTDTDPNEWINKVDSSWSGAIPATVIYRNGRKLFFKEGEMTFEELTENVMK